MTVNRTYGIGTETEIDHDKIQQYINLKLASLVLRLKQAKKLKVFLRWQNPY
jgi:hypothetical protein